MLRWFGMWFLVHVSVNRRWREGHRLVIASYFTRVQLLNHALNSMPVQPSCVSKGIPDGDRQSRGIASDIYHCRIYSSFNTLRPRQNGRHFADDIFKCIFLNEDIWIAIKISLKFVPKVRINNIPALVQIMAWCRPGDKPLAEPMMVSLLTHICVTRPQWVNRITPIYFVQML